MLVIDLQVYLMLIDFSTLSSYIYKVHNFDRDN